MCNMFLVQGDSSGGEEEDQADRTGAGGVQAKGEGGISGELVTRVTTIDYMFLLFLMICFDYLF